MGCGSSNEATEPGDEKINWNKAEIDKEFEDEDKHVGAKRKVWDKNKKKMVEVDAPQNDREEDFFEGADAGEGEQFMAVRPYKGAIKEPDNHNPESNDAPDVEFKLEYVYGYRAEDSRMNCFYNKDGHAVYFTAALGVILDQGSNKQKFFGGGQVDNASKKVARDDMGHTNDITAMDVSGCRGLAATGQNGSRPVVFVWDATSGDKKARFKIQKGSREITAIAICPKNQFVAFVDNHNDHRIYIYDIEKGTEEKQQKTGNYRIYHCAWSKKSGDAIVAVAGVKTFALYDFGDDFKRKKGIYGDAGKPTSHCCTTWDEDGLCYTGGANSHIYIWEGRNLKSNYDVHGKGFVCAIRYCEGKIVSGAKDGKVVISCPKEQKAEREIDVNCLVRSVDMHNGNIIAGLRNGTIVEINSSDKITEVMKSHSDGEAWGLDIADDDNFVTTGDDNQTISWSIKERKSTGHAQICDVDAKPKKGAASSLTEYAASKCGRAVAVNSKGNGHVAVGHNDGRVTVRGGIGSLDDIVKTLQDSDEWIEAMAYSPCGKYLAVGSHDDHIYIYDTENYSKQAGMKAHTSFIVSVDWSEDSTYIRSVCGAHELLFFKSDGWEQDPEGASNTTGVTWASSHAKYGWLVTGIFPAGTDGTHINDVDFSSCGQLIATGDDYGLVNVWRNPARKGAKPISLRGHSEHVVRTRFTPGNDYIISIGGYDKTIMQWKKQ